MVGALDSNGKAIYTKPPSLAHQRAHQTLQRNTIAIDYIHNSFILSSNHLHALSWSLISGQHPVLAGRGILRLYRHQRHPA